MRSVILVVIVGAFTGVAFALLLLLWNDVDLSVYRIASSPWRMPGRWWSGISAAPVSEIRKGHVEGQVEPGTTRTLCSARQLTKE